MLQPVWASIQWPTADVVGTNRAALTKTLRSTNATLIRALIAAAASTQDSGALRELLSAPEHAGLLVRLQHATEDGALVAGANLDAIANALIGSLLLQALVGPRPDHSLTGLIETLLDGALSTCQVH